MTLTPFRPTFVSLTGSRAALAIGLLAATFFVLLATSPNQASAAPAEGSASMTLGSDKSGKALKRAGVKFSAVRPATQKRLKGKRVKVTSDIKPNSDGNSTRNLRGGIKFSKGKRKVVLRNLGIVVNSNPMKIMALAGGKPVKAFTIKAKPSIDESTGTETYNSSALKLTKRSAKMIKSKLRVKRVPAGKVGVFQGSYQEAFEDPYLDLCNLPATSLTAATFPEAVEPPALTDPVTTVGEPITWGIRAGLNGYVNGFGGIQGLDGATVNRIPFAPPQVPPTGFTFTHEAGEYDGNGPGTADDQAVLNGAGSVMYCNEPHGFRVNIANPTVVIDGASSRIIADVSTNISGDLKRAKRVHLADLDLAAASIDDSVPGEVKWDFPDAEGPPATSSVTLSEVGSEALRLCEVNVPGAPPGCLYPPGTLLDELTVTANFAVG